MNTVLYLIAIGNMLDDTTSTDIIALHKDCNVKSQIDLYKQHLNDFSEEFIASYKQIRLNNNSIYADEESQFNEVYADLQAIRLL